MGPPPGQGGPPPFGMAPGGFGGPPPYGIPPGPPGMYVFCLLLLVRISLSKVLLFLFEHSLFIRCH